MPRIWFTLLLLLSACSTTPKPNSPAALPPLRCEEAELEGHKIRWCADVPDDEAETRDVIYYFHGNDGSEKTFWEHGSYRGLRPRWKHHDAAAPAVVAFSFGPSWYLGEETGPAGAIPADLPEHVIFPFIEAKLPFHVRRRIIYGESQGGFNATQIYLRNEGDVARVALTCPALPGVNPRAPEAEREAFIASQPGADPQTARDWFAKMSGRFPSDEAWNSHDPFKLVRKVKPKAELFIVCGTQDSYGFYGPVVRFANAVRLRGGRVHLQPVQKPGHCPQDEASLAALAQFFEDGL